MNLAAKPLPLILGGIAYGTCAPPGAPDLPIPWDEAGRALKNLGAAAEDLEQFAKGGKIWGAITRGNAKITPYFEYASGKLTAGILEAFKHGDQAGIIRAYLVFRQQSMLLARVLGVKILRLEADVVMNQTELLPRLLEMGYQPIKGKPGSYFLEILLN